MQEPRNCPRSFPWGLFGMIGLVALVESVVAAHDVTLTTIWAADWRQAGRAARSEAVDAELLCFGDSLGKIGMLPQILERETGLRSHNLAVSVGQITASAVLLDRVLDAGGTPKAIVVEMVPHLLAEGPGYNRRHWPELATPVEALQVAASARSPDFLADTILSIALRSARARFEIRQALLAALRGEPYGSFPAIAYHWRTWRVNRGAQPSPPQDGFRGDAERWPIELYPRSWRVAPANVAALRRMLTRAEARGIAVFWAIPPLSPEVQQKRQMLGLDDRYSAFVAEIQHEFEGLTVLDFRRSDYPAEVHSDPIHLDRRGAEALSVDLGRAIHERLGGPGPGSTVAMPSYRPRPLDPDVEDLEQSRLAVEMRIADLRR